MPRWYLRKLIYTDRQYGVIYKLVACLLRAERDCGRDQASEGVIHTWLKCVELAHAEGIESTDLAFHRRYRDVGDWTINYRSEPYWSDVAPPELLVQEVCES